MVRPCKKTGQKSTAKPYEKGATRAHSRRVQSHAPYDLLYRSSGCHYVPTRISLAEIKEKHFDLSKCF